MKRLVHSELSGAVYYGKIDKDKRVFVGKKEEIEEENFIATLINFIRYREEYSEDGAVVEVYGRKFNLKAMEIEER